MMKKIFSMLSLGERYLFAACFYMGLSFVLISVTPKFPSVLAYTGCGGEQMCPNGEICCGGVCCTGVCQDGVCCKSGKFCNGKCVDAGAECCTDRAIDPQTEKCCDGVIIPKHQKCCPAGDGYSAHGCDEECCKGDCMKLNEICCDDATHSRCGCCTCEECDGVSTSIDVPDDEECPE